MKREIKTTLTVDGEKEFKKSMADATREMAVLASESRAVTAAFGDNKGSVDALTERNKVLGKQIDQQEEIYKAYARAVEESTQKYGEADAKTDAYRIKMNNAATTLEKMKSEMGQNTAALEQMTSAQQKTGTEAANMGKNIKGAENQTKSFKNQIKDFAKSSTGQFMTLAGIIAAVTKALKALWKTLDDATNYADKIKTMSLQTGVAVGKLQELEYASRFVDVSLDDLTKGLAKVTKQVGDAARAGDDYIKIGNGMTVATRDANGELRDAEEIFYNVIDAIGVMSNETERNIAAQEIFGKSYQDINPLIVSGSGVLEKYGIEAKKTGIVLDDVTIAALGRLDDKFEKVAASTSASAKSMSSTFVVAADAAATVWDKLVKDITSYPEQMMKTAIMAVQLTPDPEQAAALTDQFNSLQAAIYASGLTASEFTAKHKELSDTLMNQGVPAAEAYDQALLGVANGMDALAVAQQGFDTAVLTAFEKYAVINDQYLSQVKEKTKELLDEMGGMFEAFPEMAEVSGQELLDNLDSQLNGTARWLMNLDTLISRGVDEGIVQELRDLGPKAAGEVAALNSMTEYELLKWVDMYEQKGKLATAGAVAAMSPMAEEMQRALWDVEDAIANEEAEMKRLGQQLGYGIGDGIDESTWYIESAAVAAVKASVEAARKEGVINSPSGLTRDEVGFDLGRGVGVGFLGGLEKMIPDMKSGLSGAIAALEMDTAIPLSASVRNLSYAPGGQPRGGDTYHISIDAKNVREFNDIVSIVKNARQTRRAG